MSYPIEAGVPCVRRNETLYPFMDMDVDDSFFIRTPASKLRSQQTMIRRAAKRYSRGRRVSFVTRAVKDGVRCWRVK